jgi:hypothetical protein
MADTTYTVEKIGKEDIDWGTSVFTRESRLTPGSDISITEVNASHVPVVDAAGNFTGTEVDAVLAEIGKKQVVQIRTPPIPCNAPAVHIVIMHAHKALIVQAVNFIPDWDFKESSSSFTSLSIANRGTDGTGSVGLATKILNGDGTTNAATVPISFGAIVNANVADGEVLTLYLDNTTNGNTAFIPPGILSIEFTW